MVKYRGYLASHVPFILEEIGKGTPTFRIARMLYDVYGIESQWGGSSDRKARINAINILIRHMLGSGTTKKMVIDKRISETKNKIDALRKRMAKLRAERDAA